MAVAERFLNLSKFELRSDRALVRAAQAGKREAASQLIERYYPRVKSFVTYVTASRGNAEDLTQEVFTRALAALPRFNGTYRFEPWLLRIARNLCIDESRRSSNRAAPTDPIVLPSLERISENDDDVWGRVSSGLASKLVHQALQTLPARQRTALVLREIEGLSYSDIAQVLGGSERVVEGILRRARARFRLEIARAEEVEDQRATCKRVLRTMATDSGTANLDAARHLRKCPECQQVSRRIKRSDGIFGALPPIALADRPWMDSVLGAFKAKSVRPRTVLELFRHHSTIGMASPLANALEIVASLAVAATLSVASITGQSTRVTTQLSAGPSVTDAVIVAVEPPPAAGSPVTRASSPSSIVSGGTAGTPSGDDAGGEQSAPPGDIGIFSLHSSILTANLPDISILELPTVKAAESALTNSLQELEDSVIAEDFTAAETSTGGPDSLPLELPQTLDATAITASISLPRRRFFLI